MLTGSSYKTAVEGTFRAGGCNASRSGFIGACLAAQHGLESIPQSWKDKTLRYQEIIDLANRLATIQLL
ncbi:hypothetical protein DPMN_150434 [Dreissena polymorpha]|uniref:ADP-ribosylglycohydrolase family protein n=1 Tax=Dreissena polymorpha TaxID=45954 RepID=A0A9D4FFQ6_DREPO|nr:hypothetical protein DPMN_150434 [Dreissena polymorpha]